MTSLTNSHKRFIGTLFTNCMSSNGTPCNIFNWFPMIRDGKYKTRIEEIRRLTEEGNHDDEVARLKRSLPALIPCGFIPKGKSEDSPMELSELMWIDIDIHNRAWSEAAREKLKEVLGVIASYLTPRYGLRIIVKLPSTVSMDNFYFYCQVVYDTIDKILDCKHDEQATTRVHLSSVSYDPDMWFLTPDKVVDFPIDKMVEENQRDLYARLDSKTAEDNKATDGKEAAASSEVTDSNNATDGNEQPASDTECSDELLEEEIFEALHALERQEKEEFSKAQIDDMLTRFMGHNPLVKGLRNKNLLFLGQYASYKNMSKNELEYLADATHGLIGCQEYNLKEIKRRLCWGYTHCDKHEICKTFRNKANSPVNGQDESNYGHYGHYGHRGYDFSQEPIKLSDAQGHFNKVVTKNCPCFPDQVYDNLPPFISNLLCYGESKRDKDKLLGSIFTTFSAIMNNVKVQVRDNEYSSNLFFLIIAPAASGKSIALKPQALLKNIKIKITMLNNSAKREFEEKKLNWEQYYRDCIKNGRKADFSLRPESDTYYPKILEESPQSSRSKLVTDLAHNPKGIITYAPELDLLSESLHCECGDHSAELRAIPSNESVSLSYKNNVDIIEQEFPRMSFLATGTPPQFCNFIGNTHDGMASRCLTMLGPSNDDWLSWSNCDEGKSSEKKRIYQEGAKKCSEIYEWLDQYPTHVTIPKELRAQCDQIFEFFTERIKEEGYENLRSIVNRGPIHVGRICSILVALRKAEQHSTAYELEATQQDMNVALGMVITLLKHSCLASTMLIEDGRQINAIKNVFRLEDIFNELPNMFTTAEFTDLAMKKTGYSQSTATRTLRRWLKDNYIIRIHQASYKKTNKIMMA